MWQRRQAREPSAGHTSGKQRVLRPCLSLMASDRSLRVAWSGGLRTRETSSAFKWPGSIARASVGKGLGLGSMCVAQRIVERSALVYIRPLTILAEHRRSMPVVLVGLRRARQASFRLRRWREHACGWPGLVTNGVRVTT